MKLALLAIERSGRFVVAGDSCCQRHAPNNVLVARYKRNGTLDRTFSHDGKAKVHLGSTDHGYAVAADSRGRTVVAGDEGHRFVVLRLRTDGRLDPSFGNRGIVKTPFNLGNSSARGVAVDDTGRIVVAGVVYSGSGLVEIGLARYKPNGALDRSFGAGGEVTSDFHPEAPGVSLVNALAIDSAGRIVVAGSAIGGSPNIPDIDFAIARYMPDGRRDETFGSGGAVLTDFQPGGSLASSDEAASLAIDSAGDIVAAGEAFNCPSPCTDFTQHVAVARYRPDGSLDGSFGTGGKFESSSPGSASSAAVDPTGAIAIGGDLWTPGETFAVGRLTSSGAPDPAFGSNGFVTTTFRGG